MFTQSLVLFEGNHWKAMAFLWSVLFTLVYRLTINGNRFFTHITIPCIIPSQILWRGHADFLPGLGTKLNRGGTCCLYFVKKLSSLMDSHSVIWVILLSLVVLLWTLFEFLYSAFKHLVYWHLSLTLLKIFRLINDLWQISSSSSFTQHSCFPF